MQRSLVGHFADFASDPVASPGSGAHRAIIGPRSLSDGDAATNGTIRASISAMRAHGNPALSPRRDVSMKAIGFLMLLICLPGARSASAGTLEQDEARIDAVLKAEHARDHPAPVVASVVAPTPRSATDDGVVAEREDAGLGFGELAAHVGGRVTITTVGEHVHRGIVRSADARQVTLQVHSAGGSATYALHRDQIVHIDAR
jgi:hypothetical protein